jgi:molybdopterin-guanine dinucleotide biosynthesis protein B
MLHDNNIRIIGFAGFSGSGKTALICALLPRCGRAVVLKHSHHPLHDGEGTDSRRFLSAGTSQVIVVHPSGALRLTESGEETIEPPDLDTLASQFAGCDTILIEGWKDLGSWPRIIVNREGADRLTMAPHAVAEVSDGAPATSLPFFRHAEISGLEQFLDRIR